MLPFLAQTRDTAEMANQILFWSVAALLVAGALCLAGWLIYRGYTRRRETDLNAPPFTLGDLRRMHQERQLSDEEYDRAKAALIARTQAAARKAEEPEGEESEADEPETENPGPPEPDGEPGPGAPQ